MRRPSAAVSAALVALVLAVGATSAPTWSGSGPVPEASQVAVRTPAGKPPAGKPPARGSKTAAPAQPSAGKVNCDQAKCIALTFDDGPVSQTAAVLDALKAQDARATFFVLGSMARRRPALLRRMLAEGHAIGNHSWNHPQFSRISTDAVRSQIQATSAVVRAATGRIPVMMRPPFGEQDARIRTAVRSLGSAVILWSVDTQDWKYRDANRLAGYVVDNAKRNAIVLMHDIRPTTRDAVGTIVAKLRALGYTLVTVPEALDGRLSPGKVYARG